MSKKLSQSRHYVSFQSRPNSIKTWHKVDVWQIWFRAGRPFVNTSSYDMRAKFIEWCGENLNGLWSVNQLKIYMSEDTDAAAFKLRWL